MCDFTSKAEEPRPNFSVVIPCYNSDESLKELVQRLADVFHSKMDETFEIILINDGSPNPKTWAQIQDLASANENVRGVNLMRNFGKPSAQLCGFELARGRWIVGMDDDLQHLPEDIPLLADKREHDIVFGKFSNRKHSLFDRIASRVKGWVDRIAINKPKGITVSPFRLVKSEVVKACLTIKTSHPFIPALLFYVTRDIVEVNVSHEARKFGTTGYTFFKKCNQFSNLLINNSSILLNATAFIGGLFFLWSLVYAAWLVVRHTFLFEIVPGWTSLMVAQMMIGGLIMFSIGLVGEYLTRAIKIVEERPAFLIRTTTDES